MRLWIAPFASVAGIALISAVLPVAAGASQAGTAPLIGAKNHVITSHVARFDLIRGPWTKTASNSGNYTQQATLPSGSGCSVVVDARATPVSIRPKVNEGAVALRPGTGESTIRFTHSGRRDDLRWWVGRDEHGDTAGGAYAPLPPSLRTAGKRFVLFRLVTVGSAEQLGDEDPCSDLATERAEPVLRAIGRTIRLAPAQRAGT